MLAIKWTGRYTHWAHHFEKLYLKHRYNYRHFIPSPLSIIREGVQLDPGKTQSIRALWTETLHQLDSRFATPADVLSIVSRTVSHGTTCLSVGSVSTFLENGMPGRSAGIPASNPELPMTAKDVVGTQTSSDLHRGYFACNTILGKQRSC